MGANADPWGFASTALALGTAKMRVLNSKGSVLRADSGVLGGVTGGTDVGNFGVDCIKSSTRANGSFVLGTTGDTLALKIDFCGVSFKGATCGLTILATLGLWSANSSCSFCALCAVKCLCFFKTRSYSTCIKS